MGKRVVARRGEHLHAEGELGARARITSSGNEESFW